MKIQAQTDLVKTITEIAAAMPLARTVQLYEFALFLKSHPLPAEETFEEIAADEAVWDAQFAATDDDKLAALVASVEVEINEGKTLPMFNERGEFAVARQPSASEPFLQAGERKPATLLSSDWLGI